MCAKASQKRVHYNLRSESKKSYLALNGRRQQKTQQKSAKKMRRGLGVRKFVERLGIISEATVILPSVLQPANLNGNSGSQSSLDSSLKENSQNQHYSHPYLEVKQTKIEGHMEMEMQTKEPSEEKPQGFCSYLLDTDLFEYLLADQPNDFRLEFSSLL